MARLDGLPERGWFVLANPWQEPEAAELALAEGLDYMLHSVVPDEGMVYVMDLDELERRFLDG